MTEHDRSSLEVAQIVARTPVRLRPAVAWVMETWLGRCLLRIAARFVRLEMFDRSMTVAAQMFTSVFPILIMAAVWVGSRNSEEIADAVNLPDETRSVLQDALASTDGGAFGIVGTLVVLISATSLSRALTRAFAAIWDLPRPKSGLVNAWRWLGVVILIAAALVLIRWLSRRAVDLPALENWRWLVPLVVDTVVATLVPWLLLSGKVSARLLFPGAFVFGLIMLTVRPASAVFLPRALEVSADRYGTIGVAFTYIAWLYIVSLIFLVAALVGQVIATDGGRLGVWIRGQSEDSDETVSPSVAPESTSRG